MKKNVTRIINMISANLAEVFPEFIDVFPDITSKTSLTMLEKYSVPENIVKSGLEDVISTMRKCSRNHLREREAERIMELASSSIGIPDDGSRAFRIRENVKRLRAELESIGEIEARVLYAVKDNEYVKMIDDIRGIGAVSAATIVSEIGPIGQFESAPKLQSYGGKAPIMEGSGGKDHAKRLSKIRDPHLSNAIHESAVSLVLHRNKEFYDIFQKEVNRGKEPTQAYVIVGRRLIYHIFTIMKNRKPYRQRLPKKR